MALLALALIALVYPKADAPALLWNASASVATGLYRLTSQPPLTGALAVIRLPEPLRTLAETRGYLRAGALLIKPVAAGAGDTVCRHGPLVTINGRFVARAKAADQAGRPLPSLERLLSVGADGHFRAFAGARQLRQPLLRPDRASSHIGYGRAGLGAHPVLTTALAAS